MSGQNEHPVTPEDVMEQIELLSKIIERMERPSDMYLNRLELFLMEHGEEKTKKMLKEEEGIDKLPLDISAADYLLFLSHIGRPGE